MQSTAVTTVNPNASLAEVSLISPETMEALVVQGDLRKLSSKQRLEVYKARCDAAGLDPRTQPFQYLELSGKLTLYATKTATDQIIASRKLNVTIIERKITPELGIIEAVCRVTNPATGQTVEDIGVVALAPNVKGETVANAIMKAITKAKRRTVLSACGLGMLDESETDTIKDAKFVEVDASGEIIEAEVVKSAKAEKPAGLSVKQINAINKEIQRVGLSEEDENRYYEQNHGKRNLTDLTPEEAKDMYNWLKSIPSRPTETPPAAPAPEPAPAAETPAPAPAKAPAPAPAASKHPPAEKRNVNREQIGVIKAEMARVGWTREDALAYSKSNWDRASLLEYTEYEADKLIEFLKSLENKPGDESVEDKASNEQLAKIAIMLKNEFGDFENDVAAKNTVIAHLRSHTGKESRAKLTKDEASRYIEILMEMEAARYEAQQATAELVPSSEGPQDGDPF